MTKCKYIVTNLGIPEPIVFSDNLVHSDVAREVGGTVLGAGFCCLIDDKYICYGRSTSLNIGSRGEIDNEILNRRLGGVD